MCGGGEVGGIDFQRSVMKSSSIHEASTFCESGEADSTSISNMGSMDDTKLTDDGPGCWPQRHDSEEHEVQVCPLTVTHKQSI